MAWPPVLRPEEMYPAGIDGVEARFINTASGLRVRVAEAGDTASRPIVLLHGWGCSLYAFRRLFEPLALHGYRAIALDMKGHGLSDKPLDPSEYSLQSMTDHVLQVMEALGLDEAELMGHSMGGRIAVEIVLRFPRRARRLWLINPVGFGPMPHITAARPFARAILAKGLPSPLPSRLVRIPVSVVYGRRGCCTDRDVEEYRAPTQFRGFLIASMHLLRRFDWKPLDDEARGRIVSIATIIGGGLDRVVQMVKSGAHRGLLRDAWKVRIVEDVAHVIHEEAPEEIMEMIRAG